MNTKETIIDVAYKEFLIKGYKGTSLSSIAVKVHMTKPALYYHFSNKKALFIEVFTIYFNRLSTITYKLVKTSLNAKDALRNILYHYHRLSFAEIYGEGYEAVSFNHYYFIFEAINEFPELNETFLSATVDFLTLVRSILKEGVSSGEIRKETDIEAVVYEVGVLIEGFTVIASVMKDHADDQMFERMFEIFWRGIKEQQVFFETKLT